MRRIGAALILSAAVLTGLALFEMVKAYDHASRGQEHLIKDARIWRYLIFALVAGGAGLVLIVVGTFRVVRERSRQQPGILLPPRARRRSGARRDAADAAAAADQDRGDAKG